MKKLIERIKIWYKEPVKWYEAVIFFTTLTILAIITW